MKKTLIAGLALVACAVSAQAQTPTSATPASAPARRQPLPNDSLELARKFALWTWSNMVDSLMAHSPAADRTPENRQRTSDGIAQMAARLGQEIAVVEERWVRRNGNRQYWRVARFSDFTDEPAVLRIVISPAGELIGMGLNPLSQVPPIDAEP